MNTHLGSPPEQCECNWLSNAASDPSVPIEFDPRLNEYHLVTKGAGEGRMLLYFCPFCGGSAPKSARASLFAYVPSDELHRLVALTKGVTTLSETLDKFGAPDNDHPNGYGETIPSTESDPGRAQFFRLLTYERLSDVAAVHVVVRPDDRVSFSYVPKEVARHDV